MAGKKKQETAKESAPAAVPRKAPMYLPTANPPQRNRIFLVIMAVITLLWFVGLAFLALQQAGIA